MADAPTEAGSPAWGRTGSSPAARRDRQSSAPERPSRWGEAGPCRSRRNRDADRSRPGRIREAHCWNGEGSVHPVHLAGAEGIGRRNRCLEDGRGNLKDAEIIMNYLCPMVTSKTTNQSSHGIQHHFHVK